MHHSLTTARRAATTLFVGALALSAVSACSSEDDAASPSSQQSQEQQSAASEQATATPSSGLNYPSLEKSRANMAASVADMSEQDVKANFPGGTFVNCKLGEDFFRDSYVDVGYQTVDAGTSKSAEGVEYRQYCIGFATPEGNQGSAYMEMRSTESAALAEVKDKTGLEEFSDPQLAGWKHKLTTQDSGTRVCAVYGPQDSPLERVLLTAIGDCHLLDPLVRNLHDLSLRYQELTAVANTEDAFIGPGQRPQVRLAEPVFAEKTRSIPGLDSKVTADVGEHKGTSLSIANARISSDPHGDLGRVCAEITMAGNGERQRWAPTRDLYVMTGTMLFIAMRPAGGSAAKEGSSRTQRYCTDDGVLYANSEIAIVLAHPKDGERVQATDTITPLWKARIAAEGSQLKLT